MVAAGAVTMSFAPIIVRLVDVSPSTAAFYRMGVGGIVLAAVAFHRVRINLGGRLWGLIVAAGIIFALDLAFWHRSIHYIGPGLATILGNCQIFFMAWFGWVVLGERIGRPYVLGTAMAFIGLFLLVGEGWARAQSGGDFRLGVIFGVLTALMYAAYLIALRYTQSTPGKLGPFANMGLISLAGAAGLALAVVAEGQSFAVPTIGDGVLLVAYGLIGQVFAWVMVSKGLPLVPASRASLILLLQPSLAFVWDMLLFARPTSEREIAGGALALVGIYLGTIRRDA